MAITNLKICCIINSRSGSTGEPFGDVVVKLFAKRGAHIKIFELDKGNSLKELAQDGIRHSYDVIVAAGGDGTMNAVASALVGNSAVKFGVIPRGTLNHFARTLEKIGRAHV